MVVRLTRAVLSPRPSGRKAVNRGFLPRFPPPAPYNLKGSVFGSGLFCVSRVSAGVIEPAFYGRRLDENHRSFGPLLRLLALAALEHPCSSSTKLSGAILDARMGGPKAEPQGGGEHSAGCEVPLLL